MFDGDAGSAARTGFVHDWLSCLHFSHHAVTSSAATSISLICFFTLVNLFFSVSLCPADEGTSTGPHGEG